MMWKPWDPAKRFASSITGMTWPIPGLANMAACGFVVCIASIDDLMNVWISCLVVCV